MEMIFVIMLLLLLVVGISPARVEFEGDDLIFSIPLLFIKKRQKKTELDSYRIKISAFPIILRFKDGSVYRWTSFPQWRSIETRNMLDALIRENKDRSKG
jgi:hypothetical protein